MCLHPNLSPMDEIGENCQSLESDGFPYSGRQVSCFLWFLSRVGYGEGPVEGKTNPYIRDMAGSIITIQSTINQLNRFFILLLVFS